MPRDINSPIPPQVVENPSRSPLPYTSILSGGLGGAILPNTDVIVPVPTVAGRAYTFFELLQKRMSGTNIDLSGVYVNPFEEISSSGDAGFNSHYALKIRSSADLVRDIASAILTAARNGNNSTPIAGGIGGAALRLLRRAIDSIKASVANNEVRIVGINSDPAGNADGRPGGQGGGDFGGSGRGGHSEDPNKSTAPPDDDPEAPPDEHEPCCEPTRGYMGIIAKPNVYQEKTLHFPRSDCCDDPDQTTPNERIRIINQDVERVPIIEICKDVEIPPRNETPPVDQPPQSGPITQDPSFGGAAAGGGSAGGAGFGG